MDSFALEMLIVFYDGLFRASKSTVILYVRLIAFTCALCGAVGFGLTLVAPEGAQPYLVAGGVAGVMLFIVAALWCAALVARQKKNE